MHTCIDTNEKKRMDWIDLVKVIASFMVVFQHSISHIWTSCSPESLLWKASHFPFIFSRCAVLLFFMCSGATMLQKERDLNTLFRKNIFSLLKVYFCWMIIFGMVSCISLYQENLASIRTCVNAIAKSILFGHYHTWFIFTLIGLYLITPFLSLIVQDTFRMRYFLLLSFVFSICIPMFQNMGLLERFSNTLNSIDISFVLGYVLYYVLGYRISKMEWKSQYTIISVIAFIVSLGASCFITMFHSLQTGSATQALLGDFSILTFFMTISLFAIFKSMEQMKISSIVSKISFLGFGIYLMHPLFLDYINKVTNFKIFVVIPLFYLFCIVICYLINKIKLFSFLFLK